MQNFTGCIDYSPCEFTIIKKIMNVIRKEAVKLGLKEMDTPIMEYRELLLKKYGEEAETKLIFDVGDKASLRYDLTVPLVRYMVQNGLDELRRLQIGKVFRRDNPSPESGRFCEFYQADVDIIGEYEPLVSEVEIMWMIETILEQLMISNYVIKYNYRENLVEMCNLIGIKRECDIKNICTSIDKLDKIEWNEIVVELVEKRGLSVEQCDQLNKLLSENYLMSELIDFDTKFKELCCNNKRLVFDASLARGLDYYTGIIYEVIIPSSKIKTIIAGGRYDKLLYKRKKSGKKYLPAIGVSFGISRMVFFSSVKSLSVDNIYIISNNFDMKMKLCRLFRDYGYIVDYEKIERKTLRSITYAVKNDFKYCAIYGEDDEKIKIKEIFNDEPDKIYTMLELVDRFKS